MEIDTNEWPVHTYGNTINIKDKTHALFIHMTTGFSQQIDLDS